MHIHRPIFQGQLIEKKTDNFNSFEAIGKFEKKAKKGKNLIFVLNRHQIVTHVSTSII